MTNDNTAEQLRTCREAFEAFCASPAINDPEPLKNRRGQYIEEDARLLWLGWQAACDWKNTRADSGEAVAWMVTRDRDPTFPRSYAEKERAIACVDMVTLPPFAKIVELFTHPSTTAVDASSFQAGVSDWMSRCFVPSLYSNMTERGDRLLEEVLELLQAHGYDESRVTTLVNYVYGRPVGEPAQEVGGVMVTLAGYCWIAGLDMHAAGDAELARITKPEVMAKIRAKQEAKNALHFDTPLPGNAEAA